MRRFLLPIFLSISCCAGLGAQLEPVPTDSGPTGPDYRESIRQLLGEKFIEPDRWLSLDKWMSEMPVPGPEGEDLSRYYAKCWYEIWLGVRQDEPNNYPIVNSSLQGEPLNVWEAYFTIQALSCGKAEAVDLAKKQILSILQGMGSTCKTLGPLPLAVIDIYGKTKDWYFVESCFDILERNMNLYMMNCSMNRYKIYGLQPGDSPLWMLPSGDDGISSTVDACSWLYLDCASLAEMSSILGKEDNARRWQKSADKIKATILDSMWDPTDGFFYDLDMKLKVIKSKSPRGLMPFFAGIAGPERTSGLIGDLDFVKSLIGFSSARTVGAGATADGSSVGKTDPTLIWIAIESMKRSGYHSSADKLAEEASKAMMQSPSSWETYDLFADRGSGVEGYTPSSALFVKMNSDLIAAKKAGGALDVSMNEFASTILPPEDAIISVEVKNVSGRDLSDLVVEFSSEFPVKGPVRKKAGLSAEQTMSFVFRAEVPEKVRGVSHFSAVVAALLDGNRVEAYTSRTYTLRDHVDVEPNPPNLGKFTEVKDATIPLTFRNFRVEPMRGFIVVTAPQGWLVDPASTVEFNFPFAKTQSLNSIRVTPPESGPIGEYPLTARIKYHDNRGSQEQTKVIGSLWKPILWAVAGPFDEVGEKAFDSPYPPERSIDLTAGMPGKVGESFWRAVPAEWISSFSSVTLPFDVAKGKNRMAYLYTKLKSPGADGAEFRLTADGPTAVWINGIEILRDRNRAWDRRISIKFNAGDNHVLIKTCPGDKRWKVRVSIVGSDGKLVPDLVCDLQGLKKQQ